MSRPWQPAGRENLQGSGKTCALNLRCFVVNLNFVKILRSLKSFIHGKLEVNDEQLN